MIKEWAEDIRIKTKNMNREQTAEYIRNYYWYHILLSVLALGLTILLAYHLTWGRQRTDFTLVIINQKVDFSRDEEIRDAFSKSSGIRDKYIHIDSDYLISYDDVKLEGVNVSHLEKFFFNWSSKDLDAVVMPESFYASCTRQKAAFTELSSVWQDFMPLSSMFQQDGENIGVYLEDTKLARYLVSSKDDPVVVLFPVDTKHEEAREKFLQYILE